jgi:hypothetical protein
MKKENTINFEQLIQSLRHNSDIPTIRGRNYTFIEHSPTRINGILFEQSIHYRISDINSKRITFNLIESVYEHYQLNNELPTRAQVNDFYPKELASRPCNYSVACSIVNRFVKS